MDLEKLNIYRSDKLVLIKYTFKHEGISERVYVLPEHDNMEILGKVLSEVAGYKLSLKLKALEEELKSSESKNICAMCEIKEKEQ